MRSFQLFGGAPANPSRPRPDKVVLGWHCCRVMIFLMVVCLSLAWLSPAWAGDGALDTSFDPGLGVQKIPIIRNMTSYNISPVNNLWLIYGFFNSVTVNGTTTNCNSLARLTSGALVDTNFNPPAINGEVRGVKLTDPTDPASQMLIWGQFTVSTTVNQTVYTYNNLARLNGNGTLDTTFAQTFTSDGGVSSVFVDGSGNLLVGGWSLKLNNDSSSTAYQLLRLLPSGSFDSSYTGALTAAGGYVAGIWTLPASAPAPYGSMLAISGTIPRAGTTHNDYILIRNTSNYVSPVGHIGDEVTDGPIYNMALQTINSTNYWLIVGQFRTVLGSPLSRVARLNSDLSNPTLDSTFNNLGDGANGFVNKILVQGSQVVLAGNFTAFGGNSSADPPVPPTTVGHLVRLNIDGSVDPTFTANTGTGADSRIFGLGGGSTPFICGSFRSFNGSGNPRGGLAIIDADGNLQSGYANLTANSNTPGTVYAMDFTWNSQGQPQVIIGGDFTGYNGKYHSGIARINNDGSLDDSLGAGVDGGYVRTIRTLDQGQILVGGSFYSCEAYARTSLARLNANGSLDATFKPVVTKSDGTIGAINMTDVDDSGNTLIGGHFHTINGSTSIAVARLLPDGTLDPNFNFDPTSTGLTKIRVNAGGDMGGLYPIVGEANYNGVTRGFVARLLSNGSLDPSFAIGQSPVANVALFDDEVINGGGLPDGRIYVCGNFTLVNNGTDFTIPRAHIARMTANGKLDTTWVPIGANGLINSLDVQRNGKILIGGAFSLNNTNNIARLNADGSLDTSFDAGTGTDNPVFSVAWGGNYGLNLGQAYVGGGFSHYNGTPRGGLARIVDHGLANLTGILLLLDNQQ